MPAPFAWFDATSDDSNADGSTMLKRPDDEMPFAATEKAVGLGATLIRERTKGPAGFYTVAAIPGGPQLALWKFG